MSGYTAYTVSGTDEPDYELMERLARDTDIPVIGEEMCIRDRNNRVYLHNVAVCNCFDVQSDSHKRCV